MGMVTVLRSKVGAWVWLLRVLAVLAMMSPVIWALSAKVPNLVETALTSDRGDRIAVPIELSYADYPGSSGQHVARMNLHLGNPEVLVRRRAIEILVANYLTNPRLESAELSVVGTGCQFETPPRAEYPNNATLPFMRGKGCSPLHGAPTGQLELTVRFTGPGRVGLWTYRPQGPPTDPNVIYLPDPSWSDLGLKVELRGNYVDPIGRSRYRRADLLAYMWNVSDGSVWIWIATAVAFVFLALGALAVPPGRTTPAVTLRMAGAGFLWSAGLSLLYVVVVPPFQAPDEPSHFLGYAYVTGNPGVNDDAARWGWRTHFERLRGHPEEKFRPSDIGQPYLFNWQLVSPVGFSRSSVTVPVWRRLSGLLKNASTPRQLFVLRLINAGVFSLAIAACVALIGLLADARRPESAIAMLLLVPTLPFFGTYVSNYAPAVAAYAFVASACLILFLDSPRAHWAGLPLGLGMALAIASTRSAVPMVLFASMIVLARGLLGPQGHGKRDFRRIAIFWSGIVGGAMGLAASFTGWYGQEVFNQVARISARAGSAVSIARSHPVLMAGAAVAGIVSLEWLCATLRLRWGRQVRHTVTRMIGPACRVGIAVVVGTVVASIFVRLPHLASARGAEPPTATIYVLQTLATVATPFRLRDPDFLLSTTFWGAFGWVDTLLPEFVLALLSVATAAATVMVLQRLSVTRDVRRFVWLTTIAIGFLATLSTYAVAVYWTVPDLHGRYLIGPYLIAVLVVWSPALCVEDRATASPTTACEWVARGLWLVLGVGHACALVTILTRYF